MLLCRQLHSMFCVISGLGVVPLALVLYVFVLNNLGLCSRYIAGLCVSVWQVSIAPH
jgi:hypothetical protein